MLKVLKEILKQNTMLSPMQLKQERFIQFYVNIDHIPLGKQSIANKYAPINTQNIGFIRENIELNTL
jgi:hypothetical protein